jgi:hypothetical protein
MFVSWDVKTDIKLLDVNNITPKRFTFSDGASLLILCAPIKLGSYK